MNCSIDNCSGKRIPYCDLCRHHHMLVPPIERLMRKSKVLANGCVEYTGTKVNGGKERQAGYKSKMYPAARLMWMLKNGNIRKGLLVCHKCDYPPCINIDHLFLGTPKENSRDAVRKFRLNFGENHVPHKFTEEQIKLMRFLHDKKMWTYAALARKFKVNFSTAQRICTRKSWRHLP